MKAKKYKHFKRFILFSLLLVLLLMHFHVPRVITEINNPVVVFGRNLVKGQQDIDAPSIGKPISFQSFDSTRISGYIFPSQEKPAKGTIILVHGIRSRKECYTDLSRRLSDWGYNSVAIDLRAHGESGGTHCTFGVKEKQDITALLNFLGSEEGIKEHIGIWGRSLGGAVALQAMGFDKRIAFGVIESTFTDFKTIVGDYSNYHLGFNFPPLTNYLVNRAGSIADFDPSEARPVDFCKKIHQPILIVHGDSDKKISMAYGKQNFEAIPSPDKQFIKVSGAGHLNVWKVGGDAYFNQVAGFIEKQTNIYRQKCLF